MEESVHVFISYAHEDEPFRRTLEKHLVQLKRQGLITLWQDRDISAGTDWAHEIDINLNTAQLILLLISVDFLVSDYCYSIEMKRAMERHETGEARVIPIIVREVDWEGAPFSRFQSLPTDATPINDRKWNNQDEAFVDVVKGIRRAIKDLIAAKRLQNLHTSSTQTSSKENFTRNLDIAITEIIAKYRAKEDVGPDPIKIGKVPAIVFAGTATVGKSSLINALFGGQLVTTVSPIPQDVEKVKELYWAGALKLVDSQSYDQSPQEALIQLGSADIIIHIHDIGARRSDAELAKHIQRRGKICVMVLNKCDLYTRERQTEFVQKAKEKWSLDVLCISAKQREGLNQLVIAICQALPQEIYADIINRITMLTSEKSTSHLRSEKLKSRRDICNEIIEETGEAATQIGESRILETNILPLIILYELMVKRIAKQYLGYDDVATTTDAILSIPQIAMQELIQLFPTSSPANVRKWTDCIGLLAIKVLERQINFGQISQELHYLVRVSSP